MSLEIQSTLICDGCGWRRSAEPEHRFGRGSISAQRLKHACERDGWIVVSRGRYHTEAHYCANCKDKPIKPIKSGPRKKKPHKIPPELIGFGDLGDPTKAADWWKTDEESK